MKKFIKTQKKVSALHGVAACENCKLELALRNGNLLQLYFIAIDFYQKQRKSCKKQSFLEKFS